MKSDPTRRLPRIRLAVLAAVLAVPAAVAGGALGASPAGAVTAASDITLSLSPGSGSDFATNQATLSWNVPGACAGQELDAFLYPGTGSWDTAAIETAEGVDGIQQDYFDFLDTTGATAASASTSWPNVSSGYQAFPSPARYPTTAALVSALGAGLYTIGVACVNTTTYTPILDSSGNPEAGSIILDIGATTRSWAVSPIVGTSLTLSGSGSAGSAVSSVDLTADVTAQDGSVPAGAVNFYAGPSAVGTPLNASPVPVGGNGQATYSGESGYAPDVVGWQTFTAQFVPANPEAYSGSTGVQAEVPLIMEGYDFTIDVTAKPDPSSPTSVDLTATASSPSGSVPDQDPGGGVDFVVDGTAYSATNPDTLDPMPFTFSPSGVATATLTGIGGGSHTITALLENSANEVWNPSVGVAVTVNAVTLTTGYPTTTALKAASTDDGLRLTATVTGPAGVRVPGTVSFSDGLATLGAVKLTANGTATATDYSLPAGENDFTATYTAPASASQFAPSRATLNETIPTGITWVQPGSPTIAGTAAVGDKLTVKPGTWRPAGVTLDYQWLADGAPVPGETGTTLTLSPAQYGRTITVRVTGHKAGDVTEEATSPKTVPVAKGTLKTATPKINGTAKVGDALTVTPGSWTPGTSLAYQWLADGTAIKGATRVTLKLAAAQAGEKIQVQVTGTKADYTTATVRSAATKAVAR